jgi:ABC-type Na+ efflux pump permease subunit
MNIQAGDVEMWMMAVPILNVISALKVVLTGMMRYDLIFMAIGSSAVFLAIVLFVSARLFSKESVVFRV